jgi:predicted adenylyl cyclase CyaB
MIEVERNFDLNSGDKEKLTEGATPLSKKEFEDIYYDNPEFDLTKKDYWLRERSGKWELKVPLNKETIEKRETDQYKEIDIEDEISKTLGLSGGNLRDILKLDGYEPFAKIVTKRESYQKGDFHLDFDVMDFGYVTFEAELMVETEADIPSAEKQILEFARQHGIPEHKGRGKVTVFLERFSPIHHKELVKAGVIKA